jgi:hypothetical protein
MGRKTDLLSRRLGAVCVLGSAFLTALGGLTVGLLGSGLRRGFLRGIRFWDILDAG